MKDKKDPSRAARRRLFGIAAAGAFLAGSGRAAEKAEGGEGGISPLEDLMREHGLLDRILLIYQEALRRLETPGADLNPDVLLAAARICRRFIEDYHEKLEERYVFPRFEPPGELAVLAQLLWRQHDAGRLVTDHILELANLAALRRAPDRMRLTAALREYLDMYRPHAAREDTVLFPAFRTRVGGREYEALGEKFEAEEKRQFGADGFAKTLEQVAGLEKALAIYDLAQFIPR